MAEMIPKLAEKFPSVGVIGLGLMGLPMAHNLLKAGAKLTVFNRTKSKAQSLEELGASRAQRVKDLAASVQGGIIVICVSDTPNMMQTVKALTERPLKGTLVIDMGTSAYAATQQVSDVVHRAGGSFLDAPVSGGAVGAEAGQLTIMVGGAVQDVARAKPVFDVLGKKTTHIGPTGSGQVAKAANQAIVGASLSIIGEAMLLADRAGADTGKMREALLGGFAGSKILDLHGLRMIERRFEPGGRVHTQAKDLGQTVELAQTLGLNLPNLSHCNDVWQDMVKQGFGDFDQAGSLLYAESLQKE